MRLIDADAIIEVMQKCAENPENKQALLCYRYTQRILEEAPTVEPFAPWHRVEEPPKESGKQYVVWASKGYAYCDKWLGDRWLISSVAPETVTHWMPIEPPKEDA